VHGSWAWVLPFFVAENKLAVELDVEEDSSFYIQVKRIISLSVSVETTMILLNSQVDYVTVTFSNLKRSFEVEAKLKVLHHERLGLTLDASLESATINLVSL